MKILPGAIPQLAIYLNNLYRITKQKNLFVFIRVPEANDRDIHSPSALIMPLIFRREDSRDFLSTQEANRLLGKLAIAPVPLFLVPSQSQTDAPFFKGSAFSALVYIGKYSC